ncbi:hypothetical protein PPL_06158 [Heterostelium album PN500]|uniref:Uncharacterized protein n=1 Tax=Heterostelium pallidum (strain ATCC 26659 / Pp 5 / PN500) TaxID=670386 RepID=D3BCD3_HETP5|nr:hypothetical protein PPL_06158 [Heterostelium album PN500]EFA80923.1 hypothetical protein PPL_06158 [Heterostelium album PN500]|eukprot:XP_020433041.1 hypothetical protein PPL_06158 [Heterostelium album PN500]
MIEGYCRSMNKFLSHSCNSLNLQFQLDLASPYFIENDHNKNNNNSNEKYNDNNKNVNNNKKEKINEFKLFLYCESTIRVTIQVSTFPHYSTPPSSPLTGIHGCYLVYDVLLPETFVIMKKYYEEVYQLLDWYEREHSKAKANSPNNIEQSEFPLAKDIIFIVVASMADRINENNHDQATETFNEAEQWRLSKGINLHFLTSSKVNLNIESLFHTMTLDILKHRASKIDYETSLNFEKLSRSTCNIFCT